MIIHQPEIIQKDGKTILYARLEVIGDRKHLPPYLWYRVPSSYEQYLTNHSDAFLLPALSSAMIWNEPLEVRGSVSPKLAYHLPEYQHILNYKLGYVINQIDVQYEKLEAAPVDPQGVGFTFSGGADSFYTLHQHLPENQPSPEYQASHGLFIHGFDISNKDKEKFNSLHAHFQKGLREINIDLVPIETNIGHSAWPSVNNLRLFSFVLAGSALALNGLFKRFIISSTHDYEVNLTRRTTTAVPELDRLFSSDTLDIDHYGHDRTRMEKVEVISDWPLAQEYLRICGNSKQDSLRNCGRCPKCARTMATLYTVGKLDKFKTFDNRFKKDIDLLRWGRKLTPTDGYVRRTMSFVRARKPHLLFWLRIAYIFGWLRFQALRLLPAFVKRWLNRFGMFVSVYQDEKAFENKEILGFIKET